MCTQALCSLSYYVSVDPPPPPTVIKRRQWLHDDTTTYRDTTTTTTTTTTRTTKTTRTTTAKTRTTTTTEPRGTTWNDHQQTRRSPSETRRSPRALQHTSGDERGQAISLQVLVGFISTAAMLPPSYEKDTNALQRKLRHGERLSALCTPSCTKSPYTEGFNPAVCTHTCCILIPKP